MEQGHPNIMRMYDAIDAHRQIYLILEHCPGKMLQSLHKRAAKGYLPEDVCAKILRQILGAIQFCHGLNISHRDIKLENILVDIESHHLSTKIIDFGFSI